MIIKELTIVTAAGVKPYRVGQMINDKRIAVIRMTQLIFTGDPYDHYCGYDDKGNMLFSVNCLCPCEIEYY
jgi:hypothetical protein